MKTHIYNKKLNGEISKCSWCGEIGINYQHHIAGRRYSDDCIWLCWRCHRRTHDNPKQAYEAGILRHHNFYINDNMADKKEKTKKCDHSATYFSKDKGDYICQYCGKTVGKLRMGKKKKKK